MINSVLYQLTAQCELTVVTVDVVVLRRAVRFVHGAGARWSLGLSQRPRGIHVVPSSALGVYTETDSLLYGTLQWTDIFRHGIQYFFTSDAVDSIFSFFFAAVFIFNIICEIFRSERIELLLD